jgi:hypothetical protein
MAIEQAYLQILPEDYCGVDVALVSSAPVMPSVFCGSTGLSPLVTQEEKRAVTK